MLAKKLYAECLDKATTLEEESKFQSAIQQLRLAKRYTVDEGERFHINHWIDRLQQKRVISQEVANKIYNILMVEINTLENGREDFVWFITHNLQGEFRLNSKLGFGGKFWWGDKWRVTHYLEDYTLESQDSEQRVNQKLNEFWSATY